MEPEREETQDLDTDERNEPTFFSASAQPDESDTDNKVGLVILLILIPVMVAMIALVCGMIYKREHDSKPKQKTPVSNVGQVSGKEPATNAVPVPDETSSADSAAPIEDSQDTETSASAPEPDDSWRDAYAEYLRKGIQGKTHYALIDFDQNGIPEMMLAKTYPQEEAMFDTVDCLTYINGSVADANIDYHDIPLGCIYSEGIYANLQQGCYFCGELAQYLFMFNGRNFDLREESIQDNRQSFKIEYTYDITDSAPIYQYHADVAVKMEIAYQELLGKHMDSNSYDLSSSFYGYYDINQDDTPELFLSYGTSVADYTWEVYTFDGKTAVNLLTTGVGTFYYQADEGILVNESGFRGFSELDIYQMKNDALTLIDTYSYSESDGTAKHGDSTITSDAYFSAVETYRNLPEVETKCSFYYFN